MTRIFITKSIRIDERVDKVFMAVTDWPHQSEWIIATSTRAVDGKGNGVGAKLVARTSVGPLGFDDRMTITEWEPPLRCVVVHTGRVVRGRGIFSVESIDAHSSLFTWTEDTELPFGVFGLFAWQLIKRPVGFGISRSLRRFKSYVEKTSLE